jgi:hypothetical protein
MDIRYCPSCGTARHLNGAFCISCGYRLGSEAVPTSPFMVDLPKQAPDPHWRTPVLFSSNNENLIKVIRILVALSPLIASFVLADDWYWVEDIQLIWLVCVFPPALLVVVPILHKGRIFGIEASDDRFVLMSAFASLFVALRAFGALIQQWFTDSAVADFSHVLGLLGFVIFVVSFPWKKPIRSWFVTDFSPINISIAALAAIIFAVSIMKDGWFFVFSPVSMSGPNLLGYGFVVLLAATGFLAAPWRHCVAIPIGVFSILSQIANAWFASGSVRIFPNLISFACCIALCFPWEDMTKQEKANF